MKEKYQAVPTVSEFPETLKILPKLLEYQKALAELRAVIETKSQTLPTVSEFPEILNLLETVTEVLTMFAALHEGTVSMVIDMQKLVAQLTTIQMERFR